MRKLKKVVITMAYQIHSSDHATSTQYHQLLKLPSPQRLSKTNNTHLFVDPKMKTSGVPTSLSGPQMTKFSDTPHLQLTLIMMLRRKTLLQHFLMTWYGLKNEYPTDIYALIWLWLTEQKVYPPNCRSPSMSQYLENWNP